MRSAKGSHPHPHPPLLLREISFSGRHPLDESCRPQSRRSQGWRLSRLGATVRRSAASTAPPAHRDLDISSTMRCQQQFHDAMSTNTSGETLPQKQRNPRRCGLGHPFHVDGGHHCVPFEVCLGDVSEVTFCMPCQQLQEQTRSTLPARRCLKQHRKTLFVKCDMPSHPTTHTTAGEGGGGGTSFFTFPGRSPPPTATTS